MKMEENHTASDKVTENQANLSRRDVLMQGLTVGAGMVVLGGALSGWQQNQVAEPKEMVTHGQVNIGLPSKYPAGTVSKEYLARNGFAVANESGTIIALRLRCTHLGCAVAWQQDRDLFVCPCHASTFDILGRVVHGPARKPLPAVVAQKNADGTLTVDLDKLFAIPV